MSGPVLLAIDAGTGSCRAVAFDPAGHQLGIGLREYVHASVPGVPGSQVFDTTTNWRLICDCIGEAMAHAGCSANDVVAVSATSMREGIVLYDAAGEVLFACPNVDSRAGAEAADLVASGAAQKIYELAGDWVSITSPARLRWLARHEPGVLAATRHLGMLGDWILYRLCGTFVTDPSLGSSSGMFDLSTRGWSPEVVELCGLDPQIVPEVVQPGTVVGALTASAAEQTGLAVGTPVVAGGADTQLALTGIGVNEPGAFTVVGGSFWQSTLLCDAALLDPEMRLRTLCHSEPGRWMIEGIGFYCGMVMRWFREAFCELEVGEAAASGADVYALLERQAVRMAPGSNGVVAIFSNLMQSNHWVHASPALIGFDVSDPRSARASCLRAIEESAAYVARGHCAILQEVSGTEMSEVVFTGGAAKGTLWPEILADVLGVPVRIPKVKESTALGAALYAGVGAGLWDDAAAVGAELSVFERELTPDLDRRSRYEELFQIWGAIYRHELELVEKGLTRPFWRPAEVPEVSPQLGGHDPNRRIHA
ncbi:MAG: hypothetical protein JWM85_3037 [Acidimicrobiaceae bacterium]|nr:hypothetical protein [Acidimicrobiaceae bacterium]